MTFSLNLDSRTPFFLTQISNPPPPSCRSNGWWCDEGLCPLYHRTFPTCGCSLSFGGSRSMCLTLFRRLSFPLDRRHLQGCGGFRCLRFVLAGRFAVMFDLRQIWCLDQILSFFSDLFHPHRR